MKFKNQVTLVMCGGPVIGTATAKRFAKEGARVAILGRRRHELDIVVSVDQQSGGEALAIEADVSIKR